MEVLSLRASGEHAASLLIAEEAHVVIVGLLGNALLFRRRADSQHQN